MPELRQESHRTQEPEVVLREVPKEPVPRHVRGLWRHDRWTIGWLAQGSPTMQRVCKPARRHPLSAQLHELWREGSCPSEALPMRDAHDRRRLMLQVRKSRPYRGRTISTGVPRPAHQGRNTYGATGSSRGTPRTPKSSAPRIRSVNLKACGISEPGGDFLHD
jgi:hypothetical protein